MELVDFKDFYQVPDLKFDIHRLRKDLDSILRKKNFDYFLIPCDTLGFLDKLMACLILNSKIVIQTIENNKPRILASVISSERLL